MTVAIILHVGVLILTVYVPATKDGSVPDDHFSTGEILIHLYAIGYTIAEISQFLNLLLENFRAQSLYEAFRIIRHQNDASHTKQLEALQSQEQDILETKLPLALHQLHQTVSQPLHSKD